MFYKIKAKNNQATILEIRSVNIILSVSITYQICPTKKRHVTLLNITEDMGFEPTHAFTRLLRFQHSLLSLLSNLPFLYMEPVGVEPTSKHLPTHLSTTIGYVFF